MDIRLAQIYPIEQPSRYKLHVACWDGSNQPLDVFVRNREGWNNWNRWRGARNDFNRQFIFSLIDFILRGTVGCSVEPIKFCLAKT